MILQPVAHPTTAKPTDNGLFVPKKAGPQADCIIGRAAPDSPSPQIRCGRQIEKAQHFRYFKIRWYRIVKTHGFLSEFSKASIKANNFLYVVAGELRNANSYRMLPTCGD